MTQLIIDNMGTIVTGLIVLGAVAAIVAGIARDRRNGKPAGCGCGCENCRAGARGCRPPAPGADVRR